MTRRTRTTPATAPPAPKRAESYRHPEAESVLRPDVGAQAQFRKTKAPQRCRYDSSLSPALDWYGQNPTRERGEALIKRVLEAESLEEAKTAAAELKGLGRPFLDWAGKAERSPPRRSSRRSKGTSATASSTCTRSSATPGTTSMTRSCGLQRRPSSRALEPTSTES